MGNQNFLFPVPTGQTAHIGTAPTAIAVADASLVPDGIMAIFEELTKQDATWLQCIK